MLNKAIFFLSTLFLGFTLQAQNSQNSDYTDIKIVIGGTMSTLFGDDIEDVSPKFGFTLGVLFQFNNTNSNTSLKTGILYESKGFTTESKGYNSESIKFSLNYITMPLHIVFGNPNEILFYIGPDLNFLFSPQATKGGTTVDIDEGIKEFDISASLGVIIVGSERLAISMGVSIGLMGTLEVDSYQTKSEYLGKNLMFPLRLEFSL